MLDFQQMFFALNVFFYIIFYLSVPSVSGWCIPFSRQLRRAGVPVNVIRDVKGCFNSFSSVNGTTTLLRDQAVDFCVSEEYTLKKMVTDQVLDMTCEMFVNTLDHFVK